MTAAFQVGKVAPPMFPGCYSACVLFKAMNHSIVARLMSTGKNTSRHTHTTYIQNLFMQIYVNEMYVLEFIQLSQMGTLQSKKCARVYSFAFITKGQHLGYLNSTSARGLPIGSH